MPFKYVFYLIETRNKSDVKKSDIKGYRRKDNMNSSTSFEPVLKISRKKSNIAKCVRDFLVRYFLFSCLLSDKSLAEPLFEIYCVAF